MAHISIFSTRYSLTHRKLSYVVSLSEIIMSKYHSLYVYI